MTELDKRTQLALDEIAARNIQRYMIDTAIRKSQDEIERRRRRRNAEILFWTILAVTFVTLVIVIAGWSQ
jgi:hypothetical protein